MIRSVQPEFLPPDPYAEATPPAQPASRPVFLPPSATHPAPAEAQNNRAVVSLIFGSGSLGLLVFSAGVLFFLTLPASIVAWILGNRAKRLGTAPDQANVAVIIADDRDDHGDVGLVARALHALGAGAEDPAGDRRRQGDEEEQPGAEGQQAEAARPEDERPDGLVVLGLLRGRRERGVRRQEDRGARPAGAPAASPNADRAAGTRAAPRA